MAIKYVDSKNLEYYNQKIKQIITDGDSVNNQVVVQLGEDGQLGGYKTGDVIIPGTPIENVIKKILAKQIPPIYIAPTISIINNGGTNAGSYEYGTKINPKIKLNFFQNDGGNVISATINKNEDLIMTTSDISLATYEEEFILTNQIVYKGLISYSEGLIKNDNLGEPYPDTHIAAGQISSNNYTFSPYRQGYFWGILDTSSTEEPLTSEIIRSGTKKNAAYASGNITGVKANSVPNRKRIFIACPADKAGVKKVIMPSAMNADCTTDFIKQNNTILIEGANGYEPIAYNIWVYEPAAISDDQTFTITLG